MTTWRVSPRPSLECALPLLFILLCFVSENTTFIRLIFFVSSLRKWLIIIPRHRGVHPAPDNPWAIPWSQVLELCLRETLVWLKTFKEKTRSLLHRIWAKPSPPAQFEITDEISATFPKKPLPRMNAHQRRLISVICPGQHTWPKPPYLRAGPKWQVGDKVLIGYYHLGSSPQHPVRQCGP